MRPSSSLSHSYTLEPDPRALRARSKWNTTLKSIIPLPEKGDERSYPDYDFSPGTYVLACYPETTSFYRAVIAAGPLAVATGQGKVRRPFPSLSLAALLLRH